MSDIQLSRSGNVNCQSSITQNGTAFRNRNQSANQVRTKKPINKCLQNNLIYAIYLPLWFEEEKMIKSKNHFGRYGNVTTIIYAAGNTSKTSDCQRDHLQAYITYSNQKEAAIAIVAVNEIAYSSKMIRTTYGTNRMCNSFYTGDKCYVRNCFYLHDQKRCINIQGPLKTDFEKQKIIAQDIVKNNLSYFISKIEELKHDQQPKDLSNSEGHNIHFPTIQQVINSLIERNLISKNAYRQAYQQYLNSKKKMSQSVKKIEYIRYTKKPEPFSQFSSKQNNKSFSQCQIKQDQLKDNLCNKNSMHEQRNKLKNQFLMDPILKSLDQLTQAQRKVPKKCTSLIEFQIVGKTQEPLSIYWQFLDEKDDCKSDQLETEESESEIQYADSFTLSYSSPPKDSRRKYSSPEFPRDDCNILTRLKQQILRNPLIKRSRLQFAQTTPVLDQRKQFEKVTILLKSSLIQ